MDRKPKLELDPPPGFDSSSNDRIRDNMTIQEIVLQLRIMHKWEDFDKLEAILLSKEKRVNTEIGQLREKLDMETLAKCHAQAEFRKREEMCEKGEKIKEAFENLLKDIKTTKSAERETIDKMRKKNGELEIEVLELRKLKEKLVEVSDGNAELRKMAGELEREVSELRKLKEKWVDVSDLNAELMKKNGELRSRLCVLEGDKNTLAALESNNGELEEKVKKNLTTIEELRKENRKLEDEKCKYHKQVQSLCRKFEELQGRVVKLEGDTERLMSVDVSANGGNNEEEVSADNGVTFNNKYEGDVHDNEFGNDKVEVSFQRNGDIRHSLGATACTAYPLSKGNKDVKGSSLAMGILESQKVIEIIDLDDDDDDECTSRVLHGKKAGFGITVKKEYPSSSVEIQQKISFSKQSFEMIKRKFSFSNSDTSASSDASASSFNLDDLPFSPAQLQAKRRKT